MEHALKRNSYFLLNNDQNIRYLKLLEKNPNISCYLGDLQRDYVLHHQIVFDLFTLISTPDEELIVNNLKQVSSPVLSFMYEKIGQHESIIRYKLHYAEHELQTIIICIFLSKRYLEQLLLQTNVGYKELENILNMSIYLSSSTILHNSKLLQNPLNTIMMDIKALHLNEELINFIIEGAVVEGKKYYDYLEGVLQ